MTRRPRPQIVIRIVGVALCVGLASCVNEQITSSRSSSLLVIERIGAARGGTSEQPVPTLLQSDVSTGGTAFDDIARVTTRIALKDPGSPENPTAPTTANSVTVTRYRVEYRRADGRNTPGVDVPFRFDGGVTFTTLTGVQTAEFVLVRASAKLEAPLLALRGGGGAIVINAIAEVTLYGRDQTGAEVVATGTISVNFADWSDEESLEEAADLASATRSPGGTGS